MAGGLRNGLCILDSEGVVKKLPRMGTMPFRTV